MLGWLLPALGVFAQTRETDSLQQRFVQYQLNAWQEKVFVHTNKTVYLVGEIAWFKVYNVDAYRHRPSTISGICYVELINKEQHSVLQAKLPMTAGCGYGSLMIPSSMPTGHYLLRAYTGWMKNFDPAFYFEQPLTIINTLKEPPPPPKPVPAAYSVRFFPEGGNLVEGLPSKIAFKVTNRRGEGVAAKGVLISQRRDTLAQFETLHAGMGSFLLEPRKGDEYNAVITVDDTVLVQRLPAVYTQGYTMTLAEAGSGRIAISVFTNTLEAGLVYLLVHTRQLLKTIQSNPVAAGKATFIIDKNSLGDGISHFTVFNSARQPVCERLYFKRPEEQLHIQASIDQPEYNTRKKATVSLQTEVKPGNPVDAGLSMAVFLLDSLQAPQYTDIASYLLLVSDLKGTIEDPGYYFENAGPDRAAAADLLMLTQGWRRFRWEDLLQGKHPYFEFAPEKEGAVINARITDRRTGLPVSNTMGWLSVPGLDFVLATATSGVNGELRFNVSNFYGHNEIIAQTNGRTDSLYRVDIGNGYSDKFSSTLLPDLSLLRQWKSLLEYRGINVQV
ncbi:MAG TPA: hypothetical protein VGM41_09405, partial [Chitinophagaceae bacterium]